jgi:hypothetical protein
MVTELLILLLILWISSQGIRNLPDPPISSDPPNEKKKKKVDDRFQLIKEEIQRLYDDLDQIVDAAHISSQYNLYVSDTETYVKNQRDIYLVVWNEEQNKLFDHNTLLGAALHELVHILCPEPGHPPLFDQIEDHLVDLSIELGLYDPNQASDPSYPCEIDDGN